MKLPAAGRGSTWLCLVARHRALGYFTSRFKVIQKDLASFEDGSIDTAFGSVGRSVADCIGCTLVNH